MKVHRIFRCLKKAEWRSGTLNQREVRCQQMHLRFELQSATRFGVFAAPGKARDPDTLPWRQSR